MTGNSQNVCWMYVGSRDRRVHRWSRDRGIIKLFNKSNNMRPLEAEFTLRQTFEPLCLTFKCDNTSPMSGRWMLPPISCLLILTHTCAKGREKRSFEYYLQPITHFKRRYNNELLWILQRKAARCDLCVVVARKPQGKLTRSCRPCLSWATVATITSSCQTVRIMDVKDKTN